MKRLDYILQNWRIGRARPYLRPGLRVLDVGTDDGALFRKLPWLNDSVGIDPACRKPSNYSGNVFVRGHFPDDLPDERPFDAITMLAVLEHIPRAQQAALATACWQWLKPGGRVLITVPSPAVDQILVVLRALKLIVAETLEQHYGFHPSESIPLFTRAGFRLEKASRFQFGLNNFFAFIKDSV